MPSKEKLLVYHKSLADSLASLMRRRRLERNRKKIDRIVEEIKRAGKALRKFRECGEFPDSEQPDRFTHRHELDRI